MQQYSLDKFLNSNASSPTYIPALDSYLHQSQGIKSVKDKIDFIIRTVDENGNAVSYTLGDDPWTIVGLIFTVNPSSVTTNMSKMIGRTQTMTGWLEEHWGEELDTITLQGSTAAFVWQTPKDLFQPNPALGITQNSTQIREDFNTYMAQPDLGSNEAPSLGNTNGLATARRRDTPSYQELKKIVGLMAGNGAIYDLYGLVQERLYIEMSYDYACYRGYIESIDIVEGAESPFRYQYTLTFKSEKTIYYFSGKTPIPPTDGKDIDYNVNAQIGIDSIG